MQERQKDVIHRLVNCEDVTIRTSQRRAGAVNIYGETFSKLTFGFIGSAQHKPAINVDRLGPEINSNVHLRTRILAHEDRFAVGEATFEPAGLAVQIAGAIHLFDDTSG